MLLTNRILCSYIGQTKYEFLFNTKAENDVTTSSPIRVSRGDGGPEFFESEVFHQCSFRHTQRRMAALNGAFRAESSYENLYDHIELFNMRSLPGCLPNGAPPGNQTYQEEAVYQNYEGNNRPVATNSTFRAKPNDEHLYDHIDLSNRQPVPSRAPAANQTYEENNRPQEPMKNIAIRHRMTFAMIAVLVLSFLAAVAASISLAIMMSSDGKFLVNLNVADSYNTCLNRLFWIGPTIFHPPGVLPFKSDEDANPKISIKPLRETNVGVGEA